MDPSALCKMAANFDPYDKNRYLPVPCIVCHLLIVVLAFSWFFGSYSRQEAIEHLESENEIGVFLVRNSNSSIGDLVLCVR